MFNAQFFSRLEWPTLGLIVLVYLVLGALVWFHASLPWWFILAVGSYAACLHSSLQHEALHGHPTRSRRLNEALIFVSPQFWLPYGRYRDLHLAHHNDLNLTCPVRDPESYYVLPDAWAAMPGWRKTLYRFNNTLFGRMLIGPAATKATIEAFRDKLKREPEGFIAQPTLALSTCPTCTAAGLAPRHVDLRPFVLTGKDRVTIVPGGLTRVALKEGSLVVNSSQGGGTKDTWILDE